MIFVDTGYFLALLQPRDGLNARVGRWATAVAEPLVTHEFVLVEVADALSSPRDRRRIAPFFAGLYAQSSLNIIPASTALLIAGLNLHSQRPDKEWSLTDCISFALMQKRGLTRALAFDHHFEQAEFEALLRHKP